MNTKELRKLDAKVAERVMGYGKLADWHWRPAFSSTIKHAWLVLEVMRERSRVQLTYDGMLWICHFFDLSAKASSETLPEAICLAALKAVEDE